MFCRSLWHIKLPNKFSICSTFTHWEYISVWHKTHCYIWIDLNVRVMNRTRLTIWIGRFDIIDLLPINTIEWFVDICQTEAHLHFHKLHCWLLYFFLFLDDLSWNNFSIDNMKDRKKSTELLPDAMIKSKTRFKSMPNYQRTTVSDQRKTIGANLQWNSIFIRNKT